MQHNFIDVGLSRLLQEGLGQLGQGVAIFDDRLRLTIWNTIFAALGGLDEGMVREGVDLVTLLAQTLKEDPDHLRQDGGLNGQSIEDLVREKEFRVMMCCRDGKYLDLRGAALPAGGYSLVYTDITERRLSEARLAELAEERARALALSEERLKLIADEVPAGIAHMDQDMRFRYTNKRFAAAYGRESADLIGLHASDVLHPRTLSESARYFEQARRGAQVDFEMRIELPGGRYKNIRTLLRPETPSSGEVIGFYFLSIDVTRSKATMSALMGSQKMDALGRMASGISHDFNNLLTIMLGNLVPLAEILGDGDLVSEYLTPAIQAARRGSALTHRLLTLARREQYDPEPIDIVAAVTEIAALLRSSMPRTLSIDLREVKGVPAAIVDRSQLEMALINLAINAKDATGGTGTLTIDVAPYDLPPESAELLHLPAGTYVRIRFTDDGCGMTAEQTERIFEPFYTSKAAGAGSGLGLSMVYGFVKQSNGSIAVDSAPGDGARFIILLPTAELRSDVAVAAERPVSKGDATAQNDPTDTEPGFPLVLLVDDDPDVRRTIRRKIAAIGYPLIEADDADQALHHLSRVGAIGMVLTDIDMPGSLDGFGLAKRIATAFPSVGVVLMSGQAILTDRGPAEAGAFSMLRKPFSDKDLATALQSASRAAARRSDPRGGTPT